MGKISEKQEIVQVVDSPPSLNSSFMLSNSGSDASMPKKSFPIMLRKDMLSPTAEPRVPQIKNRDQEEGNTVLASSHFTAPSSVDTVSIVSSNFEIDSCWDPNYTLEEGSQEPFSLEKRGTMVGQVKLSKAGEDSVVL